MAACHLGMRASEPSQTHTPKLALLHLGNDGTTVQQSRSDCTASAATDKPRTARPPIQCCTQASCYWAHQERRPCKRVQTAWCRQMDDLEHVLQTPDRVSRLKGIGQHACGCTTPVPVAATVLQTCALARPKPVVSHMRTCALAESRPVIRQSTHAHARWHSMVLANV